MVKYIRQLEGKMSGKGSKQRPTNLNSFEANFEKIFGKPKSEKDKSKSKGEKK